MKFDYLIGTMIEIPRAALTADEIAEEAEFFSFGTNDLTQMTFGFSRDDTGKIIKEYREKGIFDDDPFQSIDQVGVGKLVKMAVELGKQTRPSIKLGICGEHGRRSEVHRILQRSRTSVRILLAVPCTYRKTGCGTGCN